MIYLQVTNSVLEYSHVQLKATREVWRSPGSDGTRRQRLIGMAAQVTVMDFFDLPWPTFFENDQGNDLVLNGKVIDVKAMIYQRPPELTFAVNLFAAQVLQLQGPDVYLFTTYVRGVLYINGWISKDDFLLKSQYYPKGTKRPRKDGSYLILKADNYEVINNDLNQIPTYGWLHKIGI